MRTTPPPAPGSVVVVVAPAGTGSASQLPAPMFTPPCALHSAGVRSSHSGPESSGRQQRMSSSVAGGVGPLHGFGRQEPGPRSTPPCGRALRRGAILALGSGVVGQAAAHVVRIDRAGGDRRLQHDRALVVHDRDRLAARIDAEQLPVTARAGIELRLARAAAAGRERADAHAVDRDVEAARGDRACAPAPRACRAGRCCGRGRRPVPGLRHPGPHPSRPAPAGSMPPWPRRPRGRARSSHRTRSRRVRRSIASASSCMVPPALDRGRRSPVAPQQQPACHRNARRFAVSWPAQRGNSPTRCVPTPTR